MTGDFTIWLSVANAAWRCTARETTGQALPRQNLAQPRGVLEFEPPVVPPPPPPKSQSQKPRTGTFDVFFMM